MARRRAHKTGLPRDHSLRTTAPAWVHHGDPRFRHDETEDQDA
jgi:hypothetical protein